MTRNVRCMYHACLIFFAEECSLDDQETSTNKQEYLPEK